MNNNNKVTLCSAIVLSLALFGSSFSISAQSVDNQSSRDQVVPDQMQSASQQSIVRVSPSNSNINIPAKVNKIDFQRDDHGAGHVIVEFDKSDAQPSMSVNGNQVIISFHNAFVPETLKQRKDVSDFGTPIKFWDFTTTSDGTGIVLSISPGSKAPLAYQVGNKYMVEINPATSIDAPATAMVNGKPLNADYAYLSSNSSSGNKPSKVALRPVYKGSRVTFNFQDVPVRTILQLLAEESRINIVASDTVTGNVTLRLDGVPWDQALDIVLMSRGLDKRKDGDVIWIAPQKELSEYEQSKEDARIAIDNRKDLITEYVQINYHSAIKIRDTFNQSKPAGADDSVKAETGFLSSRGSLIADERTNMLMISDIPRKVEKMKELIDIIDRPVDQVLIEARVVVANESFVKELGSKFGIGGNIGDHISVGPNVDSNINVGDRGGVNRALMTTLGLANPAGTIGISFLNAGRFLDIELSAMEKNGRGEVVSNPRIVTTNQREARIEQGSEVGYVTMTGGTAGSVPTPNVQFKDVLLQMIVTPTITNDGRVFLDMNVKKDNIERYTDTSIGSVPQISKRQINTAVLIEDGQTVVIGGVYEFANSDDVSKVPFLGDIPFLGNLFKNKSKNKEKAELLIFVTPTVLRVAPRADLRPTIIPVVRERAVDIYVGDK